MGAKTGPMAGPVRIVIDPGDYRGRNIGDVAMLEVAVARLRSFWPDASISVFSLDPASIARIDPDSRVLDPIGAQAWSAEAILVRPAARISSAVTGCMDLSRRVRRRVPSVARHAARLALLSRGHRPRLVDEYLAAIGSADLFLLAGSGNLNDAFKRHAFVRLEMTELAIARQVVTALVGQGVGPMADDALRARAAAVLPRADLIALRDGVGSQDLLKSLGVAPERIRVTGDDAVELGYRARSDRLGSAIGFNARVAPYAGCIDGNLLARIGRIVREAAERRAAPVLAVPISRLAGNDDLAAVEPLLPQSSRSRAGAGPSTPAELLADLRQCRVVVAGSYHAALLALSMGIPAVTFAASDYYAQKFQGLVDQFGHACRTQLTSRPDFNGWLRQSIDDAWATADESRPSLLESAQRQIALGQAAYRDVRDAVERQRISSRLWVAAGEP